MLDQNRVELGDSGELVVTLRSGYDTQFKITNWSDGLQFFTVEEDRWLLEEEDAGIFLASDEDNYGSEQRDAVELFVNEIPLPIRQAVSCFSYKQFSLLRLVAQYPKLEAILLRSPNLCWLVICFAGYANWSASKVAKILQLKRANIVEILFGIKSKRLVKLVNKIKLINGSEGEYLLLLKMLKDTRVINAFNHWKSVSMIALRIIHKRPYFINSKLLLNEIIADKSIQHNLIRFANFSETYDDLHRLHRALDKTFEPKVWLAIKDSQKLTQLHDKWVTRFNNSERGRLAALEAMRDIPPFLRRNAIDNTENLLINDELLEVDFPICPIGNLPTFIQIKNCTELSEEGIFMNHCVGSYSRILLEERSYIYKLLSPERATVEVKIRGEKISVTQFKLANNKKPSPESYACLRQIITDFQSRN
ncbi:PcfJ domain-containing protein [Psychromonas sp. MME1]|uniref:PcfJ domain-containing protein n=1 Tax=Psychromonas sp. MME1 TaxID=3231032 RepID=UPI0034E22AD9